MKKPPYVSHYLVLKDLLDGVDVRQFSDTVVYLTSRIENIKRDLVLEGVEFIENITRESKYSIYKPYILNPTFSNIKKSKELLDKYSSNEVLDFLKLKQNVSDEAQGGN